MTRPRTTRRTGETSHEESSQSSTRAGARRQATEDSFNPAFIERIQAFNRDLDEDPDRFFIIESILDKRCDLKGNEEYLVRWENYPPEYDSWEPREELELNSSAMLNEFNRIDKSDNDKQELHCICRQPYRARSGGMIQCFTCTEWYHFSCIQMNMVEANSFAKWHCDKCRVTLNLRNIIKRDKVSRLYGNTRIVDIESENQVILNEDGQVVV